MRTLILSAAILSTVFLYATEPAGLSEVQQLKAKSYVERRASLPARYEYAKAQALEAVSKQYQAEIQTLEKERAALEADYRLALKATPADVFDWKTLTFTAAKTPK